MKSEKQALVPRLRFPVFRDAGEWANRSMGDLYGFHPTNTLSRDKLNYTNGDVKNIHYGDIHTKFATLFDVTNELVPFINDTESVERIRPESYCIEGDVIFADASEDLEDVGKSIEIVNTNNEKIVSGLHTILARQLTNRLAIRFGGYLFKSGAIRQQIKREAQGAKVLGISSGRLSRINVCYPPDREEQQKIADCLSSLDALIAAQADKIDALKTHKRGLMQQLFPREGETAPRLRFPEFRDAGKWIEAFLDDVCDMQSGKFIAAAEISSSFEEGMFPCFGGNGLRGYTKTYNQSGRYSLIGRQGALCGNVNLVEGDFYATEHAVVTTPKSGVSTDWLFYNLTLLNLNRFATGQAQPGLSVEVLDKVPCSIPRDEKEQQKIAECLSSLDALIATQADKINVLKTHKKGLMQQLFPSPEAVGV